MDGTLVKLNNFLIGDRLFGIPVYQRNYAWEEKNLEDLWEDLYYLEASKQHYFGTVLLKHSGQTRDLDLFKKFDRYDVIDGQQRLTTVLILLREIISQLKAIDDEQLRKAAADLEEQYLVQGVHYKLNPLGNDGDFFQKYIMGDMSPPDPDALSQERLMGAKKFFRNKLNGEKERLSSEEFIDFLIQLKQKIDDLQLIRYDVDSESDAIRIFETVNDRGRPLSNLEKTKSFLMHTSYLGMQNEALIAGRLKELNDYFSEIYSHFDDVGDTGHFDRLRLGPDDVQRYHYINSISTVDRETRNPLDNLKRRIRDKLRSDQDECVQYALNYTKGLERAFFAVKDIIDTYEKDGGDLSTRIGKIFIIERLGRIFQILIASWLRFRHDTDKMTAILALIEAFVIRVYVVSRYADGTGEGSLNRLAHRVHSQDLSYEELIEELKRIIHHYSDDQRFEEALRSEGFYRLLSARNIKYLLTEYEIRLRKDAKENLTLAQAEILSKGNKWQVEHIWPQRPVNADEMTEDMALQHQQHVHKLGNLTITAWNASLSNKPFEKKREGDPDIPAYEHSDLRIQRVLRDYSEWTPETIRAREDKIVEWALKRWRV